MGIWGTKNKKKQNEENGTGIMTDFFGAENFCLAK